MGVPVRCVLLRVDISLAEHNDAVRAHCKAVSKHGNACKKSGPRHMIDIAEMNPEQRTLLPKVAFHGFAARFQMPDKQEGFQDVTTIDFRFAGSDEKRRAWARFWV